MKIGHGCRYDCAADASVVDSIVVGGGFGNSLIAELMLWLLLWHDRCDEGKSVDVRCSMARGESSYVCSYVGSIENYHFSLKARRLRALATLST